MLLLCSNIKLTHNTLQIESIHNEISVYDANIPSIDDVNAHISDVKFIVNEQTNIRVNIDCNRLLIFNLISFELVLFIVLFVCFLTNFDNLLIDTAKK